MKLLGLLEGEQNLIWSFTRIAVLLQIQPTRAGIQRQRPAEVTDKRLLAGGNIYTEPLASLQVQLLGEMHRSDSSAASACCPPYLNKACCVCTAGLVAVGVPGIPEASIPLPPCHHLPAHKCTQSETVWPAPSRPQARPFIFFPWFPAATLSECYFPPFFFSSFFFSCCSL